MPEYCGVISQRPTTMAKTHIIEDAEKQFDFSVLDQAINDAYSENIETVIDNIQAIPVDIYSSPTPDSVVIDVRHPNEIDNKALTFAEIKLWKSPSSEFKKNLPIWTKRPPIYSTASGAL